MMRRFLLALPLLCLGSCAGRGPVTGDADTACTLIRVAETPVETQGDMLFVRAMIRGAPVVLVVDTGSDRTVLTEASANRLKLPRSQEVASTYGIGSPTSNWDAKLPNGLTLGDTRFPVESVSVANFNFTRDSGDTADGLLGADILLAFDIDLDLVDHQLTLYRTRGACSEAGPPWKEPYFELTGITTRPGRLLVPFELDGVPGMGLLDTAAERSWITLRMARRTGLEEEDLAKDSSVTALGTGLEQIPVRIHRFRELRVGPAVMHWPTLPVMALTVDAGDALIGADLLRGRRVWLSFAAQRVFMTPVEGDSAIAETR
jgi:predicted aspartyl protease